MPDKEIHQIRVMTDGTPVPYQCTVDPGDVIYWIPERTGKRIRITFTATTPVGDRDFTASAAGRHLRKNVSRTATGRHPYTVPPVRKTAKRRSEPEIIIRDRSLRSTASRK